MYSPIEGRFLSEDPLGFDARDTNPYRFAGNDPINYTDPSGLDRRPASYRVSGLRGWAKWDALWQFHSRTIDMMSLDDIPPTQYEDSLKSNIRSHAMDDDPDSPDTCGVTARKLIRVNLHSIKANLVDRFSSFLQKYPPRVIDEDKYDVNSHDPIQMKTVRLTEPQINDMANKLADGYIRAVDEFLASHPGARPSLGKRNKLLDATGIQDEFNSPWCADWASGMLASKHLHDLFANNPDFKKYLRMTGGQWNKGGYQHNWVVIYPAGYKPDPGAKSYVFLDPWKNISPEAFTPAEQVRTPLTDIGLH